METNSIIIQSLDVGIRIGFVSGCLAGAVGIVLVYALFCEFKKEWYK
jgi:hypothetical protein